MTEVIEFNTKEQYEAWLKHQGKKVKVLNVSTRTRLGINTFLWGMLGSGDATYTVTYEKKGKK